MLPGKIRQRCVWRQILSIKIRVSNILMVLEYKMSPISLVPLFIRHPIIGQSQWSPISLVPHLIGSPSHWSPNSSVPHLIGPLISTHESPIPSVPHLIGPPDSLVPHLNGPPSHWSPPHWYPKWPWLYSSHWSPISLVPQSNNGYSVLIGPPSHWSLSLTLSTLFSLAPHVIGPPSVTLGTQISLVSHLTSPPV